MLRLHMQVVPEANGFVRAAPAILAQKLPATTFVVNTRVELSGAVDGDRAGRIYLRMSMAGKGGWVGAQVGLFSVGQQAAPQGSWLDVDYFRVTAH